MAQSGAVQLSREEKLAIVSRFQNIANHEMPWKTLKPNQHGDWLNQRKEVFDSLIPLAPTKRFDAATQSFFQTNAVGVATGCDAWVYNFSAHELECNMKRTIGFYNKQLHEFTNKRTKNENLTTGEFIDVDHQKISWTVNLKKDLERGNKHTFRNNCVKVAYYRPFTKQRLYLDKAFVERPGQSALLFPNNESTNLIITLPNAGVKDFYALITNCIRDYDTYGGTQC